MSIVLLHSWSAFSKPILPIRLQLLMKSRSLTVCTFRAVMFLASQLLFDVAHEHPPRSTKAEASTFAEEARQKASAPEPIQIHLGCFRDFERRPWQTESRQKKAWRGGEKRREEGKSRGSPGEAETRPVIHMNEPPWVAFHSYLLLCGVVCLSVCDFVSFFVCVFVFCLCVCLPLWP